MSMWNRLESLYPLEVVDRTFRATFMAWKGSSGYAYVKCSDGKQREIDGNLLTEDGIPLLKEDKQNGVLFQSFQLQNRKRV